MYRIFLLIFLISNIIYASPIIINTHDKKIDDFSIKFYKDTTKKLTIKDIVSQDFTKEISSQFTFGYINANVWFKFEIENKSDVKDFILYFTEPYFDKVNLYTKKSNAWTEIKNGLSIPIKQRNIYDHNPTFNISLEKDKITTFYVLSEARVGNFAEFHIYEKNTFFEHYKIYNNSLYLVYFGGLFIIIIFNLFLYLKLKDKIYIYYVGYIISFTIFMGVFSGLILYLGLQKWYFELHLATPFFIIFLILFSMKFLEIENYNKTLAKIFKTLIIFFAVLAVLLFFNIKPWYEVISSVASIVFLLLSSSAIYVWIKGHTTAKYYILALSIYIITIAFMSSVANGWIENTDFNRYAFLVGSYFEIIFFSLMLANRFNLIQQEKLKIQDELLIIKTNNETKLENEVKTRTNEIGKLLKEKELLLQEVYHRVKNNFHLLVGLLWMEGNKIKDRQSKSIFENFSNRIYSMSLVHQLLYESKDLTKLDSKEYITKLINQIDRSYDNPLIEILRIDHALFKMDDAIAMSMIINETINNSIKHNLGEDGFKISVLFEVDQNKAKLEIKDNGKGFDIKNSHKGLGFNLINQFVDKLPNANLSIDSQAGVKTTITFAITEHLKEDTKEQEL